MSGLLLVARRDYLGYVTAWGFWLGLLLTPLILGVFMLTPVLAASSQPARYFTVIDTDNRFSRAMQAELADRAGSSSLPPAELSVAIGDPASQVSPPLLLPEFIMVPPPAIEPEALAPYLSGEMLIATPEGPRPLFAALIVSDDEGSIQYLSENMQAQALLDIARAAERKLAEERVFAAAGVSSRLIEDARSARRDVVAQRMRSGTLSGASDVTLQDRAPFIVSIALAFVLWFLVFSVVNYLLMGTIEERSNKIFDSLLTSVRLPQLLAGKLLAVLLLSLTLIAFWSGGSTLLTWAVSNRLPPDVLNQLSILGAAVLKPMMLGPALLSFLLGYLIYGALFLALGSLCDTIQEAQTLMTPLIILLMVPLFMLTIAMDDVGSPAIYGLSWVPLFTPFLLILRMPAEPPLWEVVAQLGLMVLTTYAILRLATRVYRAGAVHGAGLGDVGVWFKRLLPGRARTKPNDRA
ncbi:MAG: ABC transporter permease [Henriciella sp.]